MSMKTAIIVDSTAGLSEKLANHPDIFQIYLSTIFADGTVYVDGPDQEKTADFYRRMNTEDELPKTSQPEPKQVFDILDKIIEAGYDTVYGVFLSSKISGTYQTAVTVAQEYEDRLNIHLIDSQTTSFLMEATVINLLKLIEQDMSTANIIAEINHLLEQSAFYFTVANLDNLVKGGRLSAVGGIIGNLLNIKPILTLGHHTEGEVKVPEKVRSKKKAVNRLFDIAVEHLEQYSDHAYVTIGHTGAPADAEILQNRILEQFPELDVRVGYITPVLGTHGGSGAVSINVAPLVK